MLPELTSLLNPLLNMAYDAAEAILTVYARSQAITILTKADHTPVTQADYAAHHLLVQKLQQLTPALPILSEEATATDYSERKQWHTYWLIDPLDGTQEFINGTTEFTINIALIKQHKPVLGLVYQPMDHLCYYATAGQGAYKRETNGKVTKLGVRKKPDIPTIAISRRHNPEKLQALLAKVSDYQLLNLGSALKICKIAEGEADIYPRFGPTSEWDTAAGQCVLEEAGGQLINLQGQPLMYNTKDSLLNPKFLAIGDNQYDWLSHLIITKGVFHE